MKSLDTHIDEYYRQSELDPVTLEALLKESPRVRRRHHMSLAAAAVLLLMISGGLLFQYNSMTSKNHFILQEAAVNHQSKLELEFQATEFDELTSAMSRLEFTVAIPDKLKDQYALVGARYCTLSGKLAAHVKLSDSNNINRDVSLFMTRETGFLNNLVRSSELLEDVVVSSWSADGMFYVLASN